MLFKPSAALAAKPLRIEHPFIDGMVLLAVRADSRLFRPLEDKSRPVMALKLQADFFRAYEKIPEEMRALVGGTGSEELTEERRAELLAEADFEHFKPILDIGKQAQAAMANGYNTPAAAEKVARLIVGWEKAIDADGVEVEFSRERILGMLSDGELGDAEMSLAEDGPIQAGIWAGFLPGEALRLYIVDEISRLSAAEARETAEKKRTSSPGRSGTDGSFTGRTTSRRRATSSGKSKSRKRPAKP